MEHVAIMKKSLRLTDKVLSTEKTVESRWRVRRSAPWDRVKPGEVIYFKDSGGSNEPVRARAVVDRVEQYSDLTPGRIKSLLDEYGARLGLNGKSGEFYGQNKDKRYCILIFLRDAQPVTPFCIDKSGFPEAAGWMVVQDVNHIRRDNVYS